MQGLQSLQGQLAGFHFLTAFLKQFREANSILCVRLSSQILGPKTETVSVLLYTEFMYRTSEDILMSQTISVFFEKSKSLLHNFKWTTIHYLIHLYGESLQISNVY